MEPYLIEAIETPYREITFRSRLEARWAVFYDLLRIKYEYEPQKFDFKGLKYIPDFWLPEQGFWVEIKGPTPNEEAIAKASLLGIHTQSDVYVFGGFEADFENPIAWGYRYLPPDLAAKRIVVRSTYGEKPLLVQPELDENWHMGAYKWGRCYSCERYYTAYSQSDNMVCCDLPSYSRGNRVIRRALGIASQVRFDEGECWIDGQCPECDEQVSIIPTPADDPYHFLDFWGVVTCSHCDTFLYLTVQKRMLGMQTSRLELKFVR